MTTATAVAPVTKRIRAYFAPVDRSQRLATLFDPAQNGRFALDTPPAPWVDLGWISGWKRASETTVAAVKAGTPAVNEVLARTSVDASVRFLFHTWGKLQMSLAAGTQQMNLLQASATAAAAGSGGTAAQAMPLGPASSASVLDVGSSAASLIRPGMLLAVDVDCTGSTTGFVGSGVSGAYVKTSLADVDYVRRVTLNVGRVLCIAGGLLTLDAPLPAGVPLAGMKASIVLGFCDREGSTFFQEWSGLFVAEGQQGDRVLWHYPRLQTAAGIAEESAQSAGEYQRLHLHGSFRALPVNDACDGERIVCFRSYLPG